MSIEVEFSITNDILSNKTNNTKYITVAIIESLILSFRIIIFKVMYITIGNKNLAIIKIYELAIGESEGTRRKSAKISVEIVIYNKIFLRLILKS